MKRDIVDKLNKHDNESSYLVRIENWILGIQTNTLDVFEEEELSSHN